MSKDKSKKWVISAPLFYNYAEILDRAYHTENPNSWNIAGTAGEFLAPAELATFAINAPIKTGGNFASRVLPNFYKNALVASAVDLPANASDSKNLSDFATRAGLGLVGGGLLGATIGEIGNKIANRSANKIANENGLNSNTTPNTQNSNTAPNSAPNSNADDLATNGVWMEYSANTPQSLRKPNHTSNALRANLEDQQLTLKEQIEKTQESLKNAINKKRLDEAKTLKEKLEKAQKELGEIEKQIGFLDKERDLYPNEMRGSTFNTAEQPINSGDIKGSGFILQGDRKALPSSKLKTADIIDLVPDENGVYGVAYNGSSKELAKIATEIAKGEIQSLGAKRLVFIADNLALAAAKDAEQKISANIAKIDDDSVELYANNTALLGDIAKKYPMLNKDEQIELANKQILANASAELLEYSKFLNGGTLPNDARLLGKNLGRMILKSLNAGASKQEIIDMLLKAGISGRNSTAAKALLQTGDINAYNAQMRGGEAELIAELSNKVRVAAKNESIGAILGSAKEKAIKNDELLKKGVGNQGLDDVTTTFKSSKSGKEFEVAENGFGRELLSYDGQVANEEMKRAFLAWEAQEKKADITLNDGRKVVFLEPDEAVQLSYGNSYLYGEKDLEALFARRRAESLEQKLKRLQSHPAYENLLKMRENTKASELKGDTVGGSKPTVFYEPQSERYLRTQGGGGLPNAERSITITKADVAKLRASKADAALATKLENNLEALTGDPAASGLIDDLLTRDYHLASAAKKSELVAPKNADEVAKSAENTQKSAENTQRNSKILTNQDIKEQISKWDLSAPKQTLITNKIDGEELEKLNEHFKFKGNYPLTRQIDSEHIKHALSHHGDEKIEALRGQKAITLDDIANYENYAKTADIKEYIDKKVISKKQINGHFVVVEEALTGKNRLNFVSMWYVKGKIKDVAPVSTPKNDLDRTLSNRYDSANSSKDEIKSQGVGGKLEPLKTDESKNFKVFDGLVGFFEDNLSKRKNAYADFADGGSASGQRASRYEKSQKIELLDKYLAEYPKAKEISANIAKKLAFANRENKKLNKQQISDLFGYYKNNKESKELLDKNIEYALAKELLDPVLNESEKAFNDIAKKYGLPAKFRGRVMDDIRYRHKLATRATDHTKDQFQIQIFKDFARHLESLEKERSFSVSEAELRAASINDIEFLLKATPHLKQVKSGEDYISELNGLKQQAVMNKINELMAKGADESEFEKLSNHEYISELARAEFAKEHGFNDKLEELLNQGQVPAGLKRGFSTAEMPSAMLGGGAQQPKWANKFKTKMAKMGQEYSDEKIANLANWHKDSHAVTKEADGSPKVFYHGTSAKFDAFDIDKGKGSWLGKSFYFTDSKSKAKGYGKNVISTYLNLKNPYISKANDHYSFVNEVKEQFGVKENYGEFDPAQVLKQQGYDGVVYKDWDDEVGTIYTAFSPNQIKSIDNKGTFNPRSKMMRGFSTQALNELMLGLGSGGANAMAEDDPNKKAQAFIKGFLAGFGGAKAVSMLVKNAPKLAPQLARASEKMASDFPRLFNDRPDILGGILGRMNSAKDKFNFIFGGEKALGANKAKLKVAKDMAKNGAKDDEIWAKTGWYKDIDGKWKFEINAEGGKLDITALKKNSENELGDILKDDELFKAYPQLKDLQVFQTNETDGAAAAYQEVKVWGLSLKSISLSDDYLQKATNDEIKSTLYHEIQHAVQKIEGFGAGGNTQKLSYEKYKKLAGEAEARNAEIRLKRTYNKDDAIFLEYNRLYAKDIDKWRKLILKRWQLLAAGRQDEADKIKKQLDQREKFLEKQAVKNVEGFSNYSPHPFKTMDIAPNERIVSFDNSAELSMRESFSPELKASYDMRDKLLKSTNEVRASLNEKGKAELEKLAGSKDSKLSRDAQIMKTLENAKSNPARYAKLKNYI
ncbi:MAG: hypothetical protein MSH30_04060 [Campylobacter sp.]|nr:hypothetical protein [Campylobacter sp.]MCI7463832.1 hypothetical protein [Campylobacter sp.]